MTVSPVVSTARQRRLFCVLLRGEHHPELKSQYKYCLVKQDASRALFPFSIQLNCFSLLWLRALRRERT